MQAYLSRLDAHVAASRAHIDQLNNKIVADTSSTLATKTTIQSVSSNPHIAERRLSAIERANQLAKRRIATNSLRKLASQIVGAANAAGLTSSTEAEEISKAEDVSADAAEAALAMLAKEAAEIRIDEDQNHLADGDGDNQEASASPETLAYAAQTRACLDCLSARRSVAAAESELASLSDQFSKHLQLAGLSVSDADLVVAWRSNGAQSATAERAGADARRRYAASLTSNSAASEHASAVALRRRLIGTAADRLRANQGAIAALLRSDARVDLAEQRRQAGRLMLDTFQRPETSELAALVQEAASAVAASASFGLSGVQDAGKHRLDCRVLVDEGHGLYSLHRVLEDEIRVAESRAVARRSGAIIGSVLASLRRRVDCLEARSANWKLARTKRIETVEKLLSDCCEPVVDELSRGVDGLHELFNAHRNQPAFRLQSATSETTPSS